MTGPVCCRECAHFIDDRIGFGDGIGKCRQLEAYKAKNPGQKAIKLALIALGNAPDDPLFWGGRLKDRHCRKYQEIKDAHEKTNT